MYHDIVEQLRAAQEAKLHLEAVFDEERLSLRSQLHALQSDVHQSSAAVSEERSRADRLERELHQARAQLELEANTRRMMEERYAEKSKEMATQTDELAKALSDATDHARIADALRQELGQVRAEFDDVKALEQRTSDKMASLLEEQSNDLRILEEARARGEDLETQIRRARSENELVNRALKDASAEKDRLLKAQASEHDRIMRDHIAEADGDRAVLEREFYEMKAFTEHNERRFKDTRVELEIANSDLAALREQLQRVEHELREARHMESVLRDDLKAGRASQSDFEQRLENDERLIAQILDVALAFRSSQMKALTAAQAMSAHPSSASRHGSLADSAFSSSMRHNIISHPEEPPPIDPSDPSAALEALRAIDHDTFLEAIAKTGSTIRKWQKQCKEYRDRAKGKISFRNFAKGDLALFLPTRNSVSKPWAAFNGKCFSIHSPSTNLMFLCQCHSHTTSFRLQGILPNS